MTKPQKQLSPAQQKGSIKKTFSDSSEKSSTKISAEIHARAFNFFQDRSTSRINVGTEAREAFEEACWDAAKSDADENQRLNYNHFCPKDSEQ